MRRIMFLILLLPVLAFAAENPFEGTWKARVDSFKTTGAPDMFELKDGNFSCKSCVPPYTIKADGTLQKTPENAYRDSASFKITGPSSAEWKTQKVAKTPTMYERFIKSIRTGVNDQPDFARGAKVQKMLDACFESDRSGKSVVVS